MADYIFTVTPTPSDATVTLIAEGYTQEGNSITVAENTEVAYTVSAEGYDTKTGTATVTENTTLEVTLEESLPDIDPSDRGGDDLPDDDDVNADELITLTITPTPSDATVTLTAEGYTQSGNSISVPANTEVTYEISADGYVLQSGTTTVTETTSLPVTLNKEQVTLTIVPTPETATVIIDEEERTSITVDKDTEVAYTVSAEHYVTQTGTTTVTETAEFPITLERDVVTLTITPTPETAIVKIDNVEQTSITVDRGTEITYEVSAEHYVTQTGTTTVTETAELPIALVEVEKFNFTIVPVPETATVVIDEVETTTVEVYKGTEVSYIVSAEGYTSKSGTATVEEETSLDVELEPMVTLTIVPTPDTATVNINGEERTSITVDKGTEVSYTVSAEKYLPNTGSVTVEEDTELPITLERDVVTLTINPTPEDATVVINEEERNTITVDRGDEVTYSVSKRHYVTQESTVTLIENANFDITLVEVEKVNFTIVPTPGDSTVVIDGEERTTIEVYKGDDVTYTVSAENYTTQTDTVTVEEETSLDITLEPKVTFTVVPNPETGVVKLDGEERTSILVDKGASVTYEVSAEGYTTKTDTVTINNETTLTVTLEPKVLFTITPTPSDATVKINGEETSSTLVDVGEVTYEVSKKHYATKTNTVTVEEETSIRVTLKRLEQVTLTITPTPDTATVTIDDVEGSSSLVDKNMDTPYTVVAEGYTTVEDIANISVDTEIPVTLEPKVRLTIVPTPETATVKINDEEIASLLVDKDVEVSYEVSNEGYTTRTGTTSINEDTELPIALEPLVTFTIVPTPAESTVKINDEERTSIIVDKGTEVSYEVSYEHYITQADTYTVTEDISYPVELEEEPKYAFIIEPTPETAIVTMNGEETKEVHVYGETLVEYTVNAEGYTGTSGSETITEDLTLPISLEPMVTLTIAPTPEDATVVLTAEGYTQEGNSITVDKGTEITYEVSAENYTATSGTVTLTEDTELPVPLEPMVTFTIVPVPASSKVYINDELRTSILVDKGTEITYTVSRNNYITQTATLVLNEDVTATITLVPMYNTTNAKILHIKDAASKIKTAINNKGVTVGDDIATYADAIRNISPSGTIDITENGVVDVTSYDKANVQVNTLSILLDIDEDGKLIKKPITTFSLGDVTDIGRYALTYAEYNNESLKSVDLNSVVTISGDSGMSNAFNGCTGLTSVNLGNLTTISASYGMSRTFYNCTGLTSVNLGNLTTISGDSGMSNAFNGCTGLTSVNLGNLTTISGDDGMSYAFYNCTSLTSVDLSSLTTISADYVMGSTFYGCTSLTSVDLSSLTTISASYGMSRTFNGCTGLTSVNLGNLTTISGDNGMSYAFYGCNSLTSVDLSSLTTISADYGMSRTFYGCTSLTSVDLSSLTTISADYGMSSAFYDCIALTSLSFPALTASSFGSYTNQFHNMLSGVTGCTVHFPTELQSVIGTWSDVTAGFGGTDITVLFDLNSTEEEQPPEENTEG